MVEKKIAKIPPLVLPSVDNVKPDEEGGSIARSGFNYQDEVAVSFLIEMLENQSLLKVHCETHDDVVLVRAVDGSTTPIAEFVQVKASEPNRLWSLPDLCRRKKGKSGTSIFEISLSRDKCSEQSLFRLVTLRPVSRDLKMLTLPLGAPGREADGEQFKALKSKLDREFPGLKSKKGNGTSYWLANCLWDVRDSERAVRDGNFFRAIKLSEKEGRALLPEHVELLLTELRAVAKKAGAARWEPDRDKKIITRKTLRELWEKRTRELIDGVAEKSGGKLKAKMTEAGLPEDVIGLAIVLRRSYAAAARTSRYMETEERDRLQTKVMSDMISLRSNYIAGNLDVDSAGFHALCLARIDEMNAARPTGSEDRSAFLKGCMYDIADRCLLRFARSA